MKKMELKNLTKKLCKSGAKTIDDYKELIIDTVEFIDDKYDALLTKIEIDGENDSEN